MSRTELASEPALVARGKGRVLGLTCSSDKENRPAGLQATGLNGLQERLKHLKAKGLGRGKALQRSVAVPVQAGNRQGPAQARQASTVQGREAGSAKSYRLDHEVAALTIQLYWRSHAKHQGQRPTTGSQPIPALPAAPPGISGPALAHPSPTASTQAPSHKPPDATTPPAAQHGSRPLAAPALAAAPRASCPVTPQPAQARTAPAKPHGTSKTGVKQPPTGSKPVIPSARLLAAKHAPQAGSSTGPRTPRTAKTPRAPPPQPPLPQTPEPAHHPRAPEASASASAQTSTSDTAPSAETAPPVQTAAAAAAGRPATSSFRLPADRPAQAAPNEAGAAAGRAELTPAGAADAAGPSGRGAGAGLVPLERLNSALQLSRSAQPSFGGVSAVPRQLRAQVVPPSGRAAHSAHKLAQPGSSAGAQVKAAAPKGSLTASRSSKAEPGTPTFEEELAQEMQAGRQAAEAQHLAKVQRQKALLQCASAPQHLAAQREPPQGPPGCQKAGVPASRPQQECSPVTAGEAAPRPGLDGRVSSTTSESHAAHGAAVSWHRVGRIAPAMQSQQPAAASAVAAPSVSGPSQVKAAAEESGSQAPEQPLSCTAQLARPDAGPDEQRRMDTGFQQVWRLLNTSESQAGPLQSAEPSARTPRSPMGPQFGPQRDPPGAVLSIPSALSCQATPRLPGGNTLVEGVRAKISALEEQLTKSQAQVPSRHQVSQLKGTATLSQTRAMALQKTLELEQKKRQAYASERHLQIQVALQEQRADNNAAAARQLKLIERLRADKDALSAKCLAAASELREEQGQHAGQIASLKDGWAKELKRQRDLWNAGERSRREAWMAQKSKAVKDLTIKGLEPEMQRLMCQHQAELQAAKQAASDTSQDRLHQLMLQRDAREVALRESWARERDAALDREQSAASTRIRDLSNRYEDELQELRRRLIQEASPSAHSQAGSDAPVLQAELATARQELQVAQQSRDTAVLVFTKKQAEYDSIIADLKASHAQMAAGLKEQVSTELASLQESLLQARRAHAALQVECNGAATDKSMQARDIEGLHSELAACKQQSASQQAESNARLSSCQQELQQAQEEVRKAEAKLQHTVEALASRTAQVRELETQAEQLKQHAETVRAELSQKLQDAQDQHSKTRASLASQAAELAAQMRTLQREHEHEAHSLAQRTQQVLQHKDGLLQDSQDQLAAAQQQHSMLQAALEQQQAAMASLC